MKQYIPGNLDLDKILSERPPNFKYSKDCFIHILHLLTEIPANEKVMMDNYDYVLINAQKLQRRIRPYHLYLRYLVENGILETDGYYIPEDKSTGYRFTEKYCTLNKVEEVTKYTLIKQISKADPVKQKFSKGYSYLSKYFNDDLRFDYASAIDYLHEEYKKNKANQVINPELKFNASMLNAIKLRDHDFFFWVDDTVHRLHTNLTISKKGLRNFLTYAGMPLVAVDLKNSQPFLSTLLLDPKFYFRSFEPQNSSNLFKINNISSTINKNIFKNESELLFTIMLVKNEQSLDNTGNNDITIYKEKVIQGTLYEYLAEQIEDRYHLIFSSRTELKKIIFQVMFSDNRFIGQPDAEYKRMFREIFPDVYQVFKSIKKHGSSNLPVLLQTMEAKLILNFVAKRISEEEPDMPIYTIHDSVVCPRGKEGYVAKVIREESQNCLGSIPTLSMEPWSANYIKNYG